MKKWCTLLFSVVLMLAVSLSAAAAVPQSSDMENYVGNPGMFVSQGKNGIEVKMDASEGATFTTAWGYNCEQVMDGLTITLKDLKMNAMDESGLCIALGNYEGAYYGDRCLMFVLNASPDDGAWVFCGHGSTDTVEVIPMTGTGLYGFNDGIDVTFKWEKKDDTTWVWRVNDKEFEFADSEVKKAIDDEEFMFVSFGGWNAIANVEYTITGVGDEASIGKDASDDTDVVTSDSDGSSANNEMPIILVIAITVGSVLAIVGIAVLIFILATKKKKSV